MDQTGDPYGPVRRKPLLVQWKHAAMRVLSRASISKVMEVVERGEIAPEGTGKFRATLPAKGGRLIVVIFDELEDHLLLRTVAVTRRSKARRRWG